MKRILLASVAALGLAGTASAADLAVKAPVAYAPVFTWTGCYLGAHGGWIGSDEDYGLSPTGDYLALTAAVRAERTYSYAPNESSYILGGQFGCQGQFGSWVLGAEWDASYSGLTEDNYIAAPATANWQAFNISSKKSLDWFTTARVRLGLAFDRLLVYGTGGVALGGFDAHTDLDFLGTAAAIDATGSYRRQRIGWTAGAGLEWAFSNSWTAKAEFLYLDFGSFDYVAPVTALPTFTWTTSVDSKEYVARIGLNYLFHTGGAPVVAKY